MQHFTVVQAELDRLLSVQSLVEVPTGSCSFCSPSFLLLKTAPSGSVKARFVWDVSHLNRHLWMRTFREESLLDATRLLTVGDQLTTLDLSDSFWSCRVHPTHQHYLGVSVLCGHMLREFQLIASPFGLSCSPAHLKLLLKPVLRSLRTNGVLLSWFVDDGLLITRSFEEMVRTRQLVLDELTRRGFVVNPKKLLSLTPRTSVLYLGLVISTTPELRLSVPPDTITHVKALASDILSRSRNGHRSIHARLVRSLVGKLSFLFPALLTARLESRGLVSDLGNKHGFQRIRLSQASLANLRYFLSLPADRWTRLLSVTPETRSIRLFTDASTQALGAVLGNRLFSQSWNDSDRLLHINALELSAVTRSLLHFASTLANRSVTLFVDSRVVLGMLRRGTTRSPHLVGLLRECLETITALNLRLTVQYVKSADNPADMPSRFSALEWGLSLSWYQFLERRFHLPPTGHTLDLFAHPLNHTCPRYCTRLPYSGATYTDGLSFPWNDPTEIYWAAPPLALAGRAVLHLRHTAQPGRTRISLLLPYWPTQPWFPALVELSTHCTAVYWILVPWTAALSGRHLSCSDTLTTVISIRPEIYRNPRWQLIAIHLVF